MKRLWFALAVFIMTAGNGAIAAPWYQKTTSTNMQGTPVPMVIQARNGHIVRTSTRTIDQAQNLVAQLRSQGVTAQVAVKYPLPSDPVTRQPINGANQAAQQARTPRGTAPTQSWLDEIDVPKDPKLGRGTIVAVIDTGADLSHPHLRRSLIFGRDVADLDDDPSDRVGHGSHTAGIVHSVAPAARIIPVKVFSDTDYADDATLAAGIEWAITHKADVISMSLGRMETPEFPATILHVALEKAIRAGIIVVAAAGNYGQPANTTVPNNHPGVLTVEATFNGTRTFFSNYGVGDERTIAAPGWSILSSVPDGQYAAYSGTSMACPMVSGAMAALLGQNKKISADQAVNRLLGLNDSAVRWKGQVVPHLNVAALLARPSRMNVFGQALNGLAATYSGANLSNATVREGKDVIGQTDARGFFSLKLRPGQHHLTIAQAGFIAGETDVTVTKGQVTRLAKPVILVPTRSDDAISVVIVANTTHASLAAGYQLLDSLPEPFGGTWVTGIRDTRSDAVYGVGSFLPNGGDLGTGSLVSAPFAAQTRAGYGPPWVHIDFAPTDGFVVLPGTVFEVEVSNFFSRIELPGFEEGMPPFAIKDGVAIGDLGLEVIVTHKNKILGRFSPPMGDLNDVPITDVYAAYTQPRWNVCKVGIVGGKVVIQEVNTIQPPTEIIIPF